MGALSGLRAAYVAACKRRSAAEEDECESETRADPGVRPVDVPRGELVAGSRVRLTEAAGDLRPDDLRERGIVTKMRSLKTGRSIGGIPFTRGPLAHFLRNRFYIGEVVFKGEVLPGEQPAILDRDLFDAVQAKLNEQRNDHTTARAKSESLLIGWSIHRTVGSR